MPSLSYPADLVSHIRPDLHVLKEVSNRRGAVLLQLSDGDNLFALKIAPSEQPALARECRFLQEQPSINPHFYLADGLQDDWRWLLLHWLELPSIYHYHKHLKTRAEKAHLYKTMLEKLAQLHHLGYYHGDIQPEHFRVARDGSVYLLDFGLTHHIAEHYDYQGALVHFSAPEICQRQLDSLPLHYDATAEIYALAATIFFLHSGQLPVDYGQEPCDLHQKRQRIAMAQYHRLNALATFGWKDLENFLRIAMAHNSSDRFASLQAALKQYKL